MASGSDLKFLSDYEVAPKNSQLCGFLEEMEQCNADHIYKELVDKVLAKYSDEYSEENAHYIRNVLIEFFARTSSRKNLRKYIYEKLNTTRVDENKTLFENIVDSVTNEIQENINNLNIFKITQCSRMLNFLTVFMQNFSNNSKYNYLLEKVFPFYLCIMEVYTSQLFNSKFCKDGCVGKNILDYDDCYAVLSMTLTQLAAVLAKSEQANLKCYAVKMVILAHEILQCHNHLRFEAISKCTIILAYFSSFVPKEETEFLKYKEYPILDFVDNKENDFCLILRSKKLSNVFVNDSMKVVLNLAVYTTINQNHLMEIKIDGKQLLEVLYFNITDLGMKMTSFPDQIVPISRTVDAMAKNLTSLENFKDIFDEGFKFAWSHLDHFVEHVVISTRSFLRSLVEEGYRRLVRHDDYYLKKFFQDLNSMSVFSKVRLNALLSVCKILDYNIILINSPKVQHHLLTLATSSSDRDMAGQVYIQMMTPSLNILQEKDIIKVWLKPVLSILRQPHIKYYNVLEEIITNAFKSRPEIFPILFSFRTTSTNNENVIILKCVYFARINGITLADGEDYWRKLLSKSQLEMFMIHQDEEVRINALRVIAECQKTTEEFTEWELTYLIRYFQCNITTQTPSIKNKIITYYKKIIARHQVTYLILVKKISKELDSVEEESQCKSTIREYQNFINHFLHLLIFYLSPDANYSRRSICLDLLIFTHQFICQQQWQNLFERDDVNNLKRLLYDSYESNKSMAVELLKTLPPSEIGFNNETNSNDFFKKCMRMACDIRPSQSVSASYMFQVFLQSEYAFQSRVDSSDVTNTKQCFLMLSMIEKIEEMFEISRGDVVKAAKSTPFHGLLLSIRHLLRKRDVHEDNIVFLYFFEHLATLCLKLKDHIMPVVCNTSPEGHVPDDADDFLEYDQSSKAQQILVYSWKTMKEIMLLLAEIIQQTIFLENEGEMLEVDFLQKIGDFFMDVFITTKHRGVFEQAHVAFTTVCKSFCASKNQNLNNLPVKWLNEAVSLCTGQKIDSRLCATRRSAGLPFLILSILPTLTDSIRRTMEPLLQSSIYDDNDESRMHCLNVLRFIFKNSKLSDHVTSFVDRGAIAALKGFNSKIWGVRNSATLLFSTIIIRIFGMPKTAESDQCEENRLTLAVFYMRYKNLFEFLLEIVEKDCGKFDSLMLHPALLMLSRLYPSHNDAVNEQVKKHIPFINVCMKNPSFRTRDLAARASVSLISENHLMKQLADNFDRIGCKALTDTECHGLLLQIRHIFYTATFEDLSISDYLEKSIYLLGEAGRRHSHLTVTLYIDIIFMLLTKYRNYNNLDLLKKIVVILTSQQITEENKLTTCKTSYNWSRFQLLLFILLNKFQHVSETYTIITRILIRQLDQKNSEMKKKCLQFLIYINQQISDDEFKEHPLILSGDIEISPQIKVLTHSLDNQTKKELLTYIHSDLILFFYTELSSQPVKKHDDYFILIFLLLRFYPCFFEDLCKNETQQNILEWFLSMTKRCNEEITSAIISCFNTFMMALKSEELGQMSYVNLIRLLMESAAPTAADYRRLAVAQFLVSSQVLFKRHIFTEHEQYNILNVVMVLLEDDEAIVRNTMSMFATKPRCSLPVIPSEALSTILVSSVSQFRNDMAICFLASWALRRLPEVSRDVSEVYERGELNIFSENIPITFAASEVLHALLWNLGDVLSYEDNTIFLEEQSLLVTTLVLNSLIKVPSPMMDKQTKRTVICVLKCISRFIEDSTIGNDFHDNFRLFFITKILKFLRSSLKTDYYSTKSFLTYLYNPLLNMHFRFPCQ